MKSFDVHSGGRAAGILCEETALKGVKRVAGILAQDIALVTGMKPDVFPCPADFAGDSLIVAATIGHSSIIQDFIDKKLIDISCIEGKRECYCISIADNPFSSLPGIKKALVITGSDKRGTIYGMFRLSELCGVPPLVFWGDAEPERKDRVHLELAGDIVSKEPSVKYRGFFINDEWPAFGNWCTDRYGDVNAKAYDIIFQLLLRLKGNYLWPAMWNSSFSEDGPGIENARLADEYGVIMGASHHEPMCRAGVEWQQQYKKYGSDNTWSFISNSKAITEFWKDGILRNKDFETIITIGMRGENDSHLMGENATIQDNIDVLKKAISVQNNLIKEHISPDIKEVPRMFAIYKEVEDYYFGIDGCAGLYNWEELDDVILLYSEDNHGNLRAIPQLSEKHSGGYGIYYHFDYHGGPVSYEWLNHTNPVRAWEQLTMAYEYGIREMWIVNVGDIKGNEYLLSYFMDLAYDYGKWGISNTDSAREYTDMWLGKQFGSVLNNEQRQAVHNILDLYTLWSSVRIPESMNPGVFKNNYGELGRVYNTVDDILRQAKTLRDTLPGHALTAFDSMIFYPVMAFFSAMMVNLTAGMNHLHASRGTLIANRYAALLKEAIANDRYYVNEFHDFLDGKWNHMMASAHMCFRTWDDYDWAYPVIKEVNPIPCPKTVVSFRGEDKYNLGFHWQNRLHIRNDEMTRPDINEVVFDIDSRGDVDYSYIISSDKPWLTFSRTQGKSSTAEFMRVSVTAKCDRSKLQGVDTATVQIDFEFAGGAKKQAFLNITAGNAFKKEYPGAFMETQGYVCMHADNYSAISDAGGAGWRTVPRLGRTGNALKSFPVTRSFEEEAARPFARYDFVVSKAQDYTVTFYLSPRNPMVKGAMIRGCFSVNDCAPVMFDIAGGPDFATFDTDSCWGYGALNNIRKVSVPAALNEGLNSLCFYATAPNVILEDIVIHPADCPVAGTHLAPPESRRFPG